MKKLLAIAGLTCVLALTLNAQGTEKTKLTADQKAAKQELLEKYDTNKDGKLDKGEKARMSKTDKKQWAQVGKGHKKKNSDK